MTYEDIRKLKKEMQKADRQAMRNGIIRQSDLSLFRGFDKRKVKIIS